MDFVQINNTGKTITLNSKQDSSTTIPRRIRIEYELSTATKKDISKKKDEPSTKDLSR